MERQIGEKFWDNGFLIEVRESNRNTCAGCHYSHGRRRLCSKKYGYVGPCLAREREDKKEVIFVCIK